MSESRPLRMTMLRVVDDGAEAAPRMTMFRTLAVHDRSATSTMTVRDHDHVRDHDDHGQQLHAMARSGDHE